MAKTTKLQLSIKQCFSWLTAAVFALTFGLQLLPSAVGATGQLSARSIAMSNSAASGTGTYKLTFTPTSTAQELIIDFCANDPLVTDTCTFAAGTVPTVSFPSSSVGTATSVGSGSPVHTIKVVGLTETLNVPFTITFNSGITNPSTNTSFYARVLTYATNNAQNYSPANTSGNTPVLGTYIDSGGIALSTAANITIQSKVFETMAFCVYQTSCGTAPTLTLGDPTTGALSTASAYINSNAQYTLATNAGGGVGVSMTGTTLCRPGGTCTTGANAFTISAIGGTPAVLGLGTEQFGMCVNKNGSAALTVATKYNDSINSCTGLPAGPTTYAGTSKFGFDDAASADGTNNAAGSQILSSTGAVPSVTGSFSFLGDIAATTEAGIYSTSLNMVATGTF